MAAGMPHQFSSAGGSYGWAPGPSGTNTGKFTFFEDPYKRKELELAESGQKFGQAVTANKLDMYKNLMGSLGGQFGQVGGTTQQQPGITRGPLYTQQQIDQQTNTGVAANDARYQTLMRQLGASAANRGFGASSPAMQSQLTQLGIANIGENARTTRETPMQYIQANADQTYRTDQLAQQQWREGEDVDIRRRQQQLQALNALMSSLGGLS